MTPKKIFLIRHGESQGNIDQSLYKTVPDWKVPLTPRGKQQAQEAAGFLSGKIGNKPVLIFSSPHVRTVQTAEPIRALFPKGKYYEDPRLREQEWGNFKEEGLSLKTERERYQYGTFFYRIAHGESGADVYDRISIFLETLFRDFKKVSCPRHIIIVSHGLTIKTFLMRWFHWDVEEFEKIKTPKNCEVMEIARRSFFRKPYWKLMSDLRYRR